MSAKTKPAPARLCRCGHPRSSHEPGRPRGGCAVCGCDHYREAFTVTLKLRYDDPLTITHGNLATVEGVHAKARVWLGTPAQPNIWVMSRVEARRMAQALLRAANEADDDEEG